MKHLIQSYPVMQNKNLVFGDPCESGYSTTTSSEEGTLQRGFTQTKKQGGFEGESFLKNPKFLEMVSKETAVSGARTKRSSKRRSKAYEYSGSPISLHSTEGSPRSAPSPLTFGIPDHIPTSIDELQCENFVSSQDNLTDGLTSSLRNFGFSGHGHNYYDHTNDDAVNVAALQKFKDNLENIRTYQTAKPPTLAKQSTISSSPSGSSSGTGSPLRPSPIRSIVSHQQTGSPTAPVQFSSDESLTSIKAITPPTPTQRKSAFVVVKPRVINRSKTTEGPAPAMKEQQKNIFQHTCHHNEIHRPTTLSYQPIAEQLQSPSPRDIIYIPAQIDEHGVARPVSNTYLPSPTSSCSSRSANHHDDECRSVDKCNHRNVTKQRKGRKNTENGLPAAEVLSNEAVRLRKYLENAEAKNLKKVLEKLLKSKDPNSIHAMTKLFPGSKFKSDAAHCVRCHKDFNPSEPGRCILPHPERMVTKVSQDAIGADFKCGCCDASFRLIQMDFYEESTNAFLTGHCYSGTHTTDPDSVDYRTAGGSAKSCEEFGCIEFYV